MNRRQFMQEVRRVAGWRRVVEFHFDPPHDGINIRWRPVPASPLGPWSEHFIRFSEMTEETLTVLKIRWMVEQ